MTLKTLWRRWRGHRPEDRLDACDWIHDKPPASTCVKITVHHDYGSRPSAVQAVKLLRGAVPHALHRIRAEPHEVVIVQGDLEELPGEESAMTRFDFIDVEDQTRLAILTVDHAPRLLDAEGQVVAMNGHDYVRLTVLAVMTREGDNE